MPKTLKETCEKKRAFPDVFSATWVGEKQNLGVYQCNICHRWHLTSRRKWESYVRLQRVWRGLPRVGQ